MLVFALWLFFAVLIGVNASGKGRSGFGWFCLSCLISPLLSVLCLLAVGTLKDGEKIA